MIVNVWYCFYAEVQFLLKTQKYDEWWNDREDYADDERMDWWLIKTSMRSCCGVLAVAGSSGSADIVAVVMTQSEDARGRLITAALEWATVLIESLVYLTQRILAQTTAPTTTCMCLSALIDGVICTANHEDYKMNLKFQPSLSCYHNINCMIPVTSWSGQLIWVEVLLQLWKW